MKFKVNSLDTNKIILKGTLTAFVNGILHGLNRTSEFGYREIEILNNLESIERNYEVPEGYYILRFFDKDDNGFEAGKTPNGYSITL
jgi:hypothetical protein